MVITLGQVGVALCTVVGIILFVAIFVKGNKSYDKRPNNSGNSNTTTTTTTTTTKEERTTKLK